MKDGYFVGRRIRYDGGHAILHTSGNTIEFYDEQGDLSKTVVVEVANGEAA